MLPLHRSRLAISVCCASHPILSCTKAKPSGLLVSFPYPVGLGSGPRKLLEQRVRNLLFSQNHGTGSAGSEVIGFRIRVGAGDDVQFRIC